MGARRSHPAVAWCVVVGCPNARHARRLCAAHYQRWQQGHDLGATTEPVDAVDAPHSDRPPSATDNRYANGGAEVCQCATPRPTPSWVGDCATCRLLIVTRVSPRLRDAYRAAFPREWANAIAAGVGDE